MVRWPSPSLAARARLRIYDGAVKAPAQLPAINLQDALSIAPLVIEHEPHNAERAAVRWLGRWALESREATLDGLSRRLWRCPCSPTSPSGGSGYCGDLSHRCGRTLRR